MSYSLLRLVSQQAESPTDDPNCALDTESVIKALVGSVGQGSATPSKVAALTWLHHLNMKMPSQVRILISRHMFRNKQIEMIVIYIFTLGEQKAARKFQSFSQRLVRPFGRGCATHLDCLGLSVR